MIGYKINNGFIDFAKTDFKCPYCQKQYDDTNDKYSNRCNSNKNFCTSIKCECGEKFNVTYTIESELVSFK